MTSQLGSTTRINIDQGEFWLLVGLPGRRELYGDRFLRQLISTETQGTPILKSPKFFCGHFWAPQEKSEPPSPSPCRPRDFSESDRFGGHSGRPGCLARGEFWGRVLSCVEASISSGGSGCFLMRSKLDAISSI